MAEHGEGEGAEGGPHLRSATASCSVMAMGPRFLSTDTCPRARRDRVDHKVTEHRHHSQN